jgi:aspartyl protease family protein
LDKILTIAALVVFAAFGAFRYVQSVPKAAAGTGTAQAAPSVASRALVTLVPDRLGHYSAELQINGARLAMLVDTGASAVVLSSEDAGRAGVWPGPGDFRVKVGTANGAVDAAPVTLREVRLDGIVLRDVEALVMPRGRLNGSLLGMSFLRRLSGFEIAQGRLVLTQ